MTTQTVLTRKPKVIDEKDAFGDVACTLQKQFFGKHSNDDDFPL